MSGIRKDRRLVCDMIADSYGMAIAAEFTKPLRHRHPMRSPGRWQKRTAALEVIRRYLDSHGRLFEISESTHPAGPTS